MWIRRMRARYITVTKSRQRTILINRDIYEEGLLTMVSREPPS